MPTCPQCSEAYEGEEHACRGLTETAPSTARVIAGLTLNAGDQVGEYIIQERLGEGGFGTVYKAIHPIIKKKAAIKVLNPAMSSNPKHVSRFIDEARAVNEIGHQNIIDIFSFGVTAGGQHYYTMAYLEGETLEQAIKLGKYRELDSALPILRQIGLALDAAHQRGIVHRDLKPANIMIGDGSPPLVKLLDFGVAKLLSEDDAREYKTRTGAPIGTPQYMSPEQTRGRAVDHRTDVYAFGVVTYEMLTGKRPFVGESPVVTMMKHLSETPTPPSQLRNDLSPGIDAAVMRALSKDPAERPGSLAEMIAELEAARDGKVVAPRSKRGPAMLAAAAMLLVAAAAIHLSRDQAARRPPPRPQPPPVVDTTAPVAPAMPLKISLAIGGAPEVEAFDADTGEKLGDSTEPIALPRSDRARRIELRAKGYLSEVREILPEKDLAIDVRLKRKPAKPPPAKTHDDLERPFRR